MIVSLSSDISLEAGGGKGANLARLVRAGFPVPPGFVVTTCAYRDYLSRNNLEPGIREIARAARTENPASLDAASAAIRARFASAELPSTLAAAIRDAYAALGQPPVAVRSSATTEDLPDLSFAGQHDTLLNVIGDVPLLHAVVHCWSSLWTARAIGYRARNGIAHDEAVLAVVVQQMVAADVSGVLFTANPLTGKRSESVIDATFGLGEALVSGRVEPDHYVVDDSTGRVLERRIGAKSVSIRARSDGGILEAREDATARATLTDAEVLELSSIGRRVADAFGAPQDIEWARAAGRFHVLQARPITSLFPLPQDVPGDGIHLLVSAGAVQGMLDPITPLGRDVFQVALARTLASIGGPLTARRNPVVDAGERIFLDITGVVRDPRLRVGLRNVLSVVEPTTGEALDEVLMDGGSATAASRVRFRVPSPRFLLLVTRALGNMTYNLLRPHHGRARVQRRLAAAIDAFERKSATAHSLAERVALLQQAFSWILHTGLPLLAPAFGSGLANLRLLHALAARLPDGEQRLLELTRGLPHNVTTEMDLALWDVARAIRSDPQAAAFFGAADPGVLARESIAGRLPPAAQTAVDRFLRTYGVRGVGEIDLGRPRWRDDPTPLMQVLQSYLRIEDAAQAPDAVFRRGAESAERALASLIADTRRTRFGWLKAIVMRLAARRMRALAGLRESPKFTMITMLGAVRASLLAGGNELVAKGILDAPDDIFFLHLDELRSVDAGEARDWRSLVRGRRQSYAREKRRRRVPRLLLTDGRAFFGGTGAGERVEAATLVGTPVSPGVSVGIVRVVFDPGKEQLAPGEILVCPGTDPAWTPLFLAAAGLVTEVGGLMTHGSVVAREYGIPAVVGVRDATTRLRTGDRVRVDGTSGRITILAG
jgi:phosphohistidine swiveling domain-containing protein